MVLMPEDEFNSECLGSVTLTCGTDNQGNMHLMDKLLTTKYPLGVVLMELSSQLGRRGASLRASWIPRLQNEEADALTSWDFRHFDPKLRIDVNLEELRFSIVNELFDAGDSYLSELDDLRAKGKVAAAASSSVPGTKRRKQKGNALKDRDPW